MNEMKDEKEQAKKRKAVDDMITTLQGKGIDIFRVADNPERTKVEYLPTGIDTVDAALGGGLAKGMVTTIWGPYNCGKTWFCMEVAKKVVEQGGQVLYIDMEGMTKTLDVIKETIGVGIEDIVVLSAAQYGDQIIDVVEGLLFDKKTKKPRNLIDLVIVDSISNIVPKSNLDKTDLKGAADGGKVGSHAKLMTDWLSRYYGRGVASGDQIVLLISQVRAAINTTGASHGPEYQMSGGNSILHNSKVIMKFGKKNTWVEVKSEGGKAERKLIGHTVMINAERNAVTGIQGTKAEYSVKYGVGIDDAEALVAKAQLPEWGYIISQKRGWFTIICPGLGDVEVKGKANLPNVVRARAEIGHSLRTALSGPKPLTPPALIGAPYNIDVTDITDENEEE